MNVDDGTALWRACTRKHKYATEALALQVASRSHPPRRSKHGTAERLYTYRCRHCGCWHLTSRAPWGKEAAS